MDKEEILCIPPIHIWDIVSDQQNAISKNDQLVSRKSQKIEINRY